MITAEKIYSNRPEIKKKVYEVYPVTKAEKKCAIEKSKAEWKRFELAKKMYQNNES